MQNVFRCIDLAALCVKRPETAESCRVLEWMLALAFDDGERFLVIGRRTMEVSALLIGVTEIGHDDPLLNSRKVPRRKQQVCGLDQLWNFVMAAQFRQWEYRAVVVVRASASCRENEHQEHTNQDSPHGTRSFAGDGHSDLQDLPQC